MPRCPEKRKAYAVAYREANKERLRAEARERMAKVPNEVKAERARAWRATTKGRHAKAREHYAHAVANGFAGSFEEWAGRQCPGRELSATVDALVGRVSWVRLRAWATEDGRLAWQRDRYKIRYWSDPEFRDRERAKARMRKHSYFGPITTRLRDGMKRPMSVWSKAHRLFALLGFTPCQLREHLAARFSDGMTWAAFWRGEIHIDHVVPLCMWDIEDENQLRQSTQLENLQPLWARDNLVKAARAA